jgi:hypothetical protein
MTGAWRGAGARGDRQWVHGAVPPPPTPRARCPGGAGRCKLRWARRQARPRAAPNAARRAHQDGGICVTLDDERLAQQLLHGEGRGGGAGVRWAAAPQRRRRCRELQGNASAPRPRSRGARNGQGTPVRPLLDGAAHPLPPPRAPTWTSSLRAHDTGWCGRAACCLSCGAITRAAAPGASHSGAPGAAAAAPPAIAAAAAAAAAVAAGSYWGAAPRAPRWCAIGPPPSSGSPGRKW